MICSKKITVLVLLILFIGNAYSQNYRDPEGRMLYEVLVTESNDSLYLLNLSPFYVFPPLKFKNKSQEKFYWKTIRDVKKTLPYARIVGKTLNDANAVLEKLPDDASRKRYLKELEKQVKKKYEPDLRKMTFSQGKMLIRLINRETSYTSYELIKMYRGTFAAFFWQGIAKIFGADLKLEYDGSDKERIIERVIILVEAGQL
jgi:hypothetical protein